MQLGVIMIVLLWSGVALAQGGPSNQGMDQAAIDTVVKWCGTFFLIGLVVGFITRFLSGKNN